jgi:hypothetical protein
MLSYAGKWKPITISKDGQVYPSDAGKKTVDCAKSKMHKYGFTAICIMLTGGQVIKIFATPISAATKAENM